MRTEYRTPVGTFDSWDEAANACNYCDYEPLDVIETVAVAETPAARVRRETKELFAG
jgi:hypothetical protein